MKLEMRRELAREPFEEKIRKVSQLIRLARTFPRRDTAPASSPPASPTPPMSKVELGVAGKDGWFDDIKVWNAE